MDIFKMSKIKIPKRLLKKKVHLFEKVQQNEKNVNFRFKMYPYFVVVIYFWK
jgi:hypothetical protein